MIPFKIQVVLYKSRKWRDELKGLYDDNTLEANYIFEVEMPSITVGQHSFVLKDDNILEIGHKWFREKELIPMAQIGNLKVPLEEMLRLKATDYLMRRIPRDLIPMLNTEFDIKILEG